MNTKGSYISYSYIIYYNISNTSIACSAGVGRTGTLIAIDIALSQASKEKQVDIPKIIAGMRRQRMKMVQTVVCIIIIVDQGATMLSSRYYQ